MDADAGFRDQPRLRGNDWRTLEPPALDGWQPSRSVSVVIPAYHAEATLSLTLAALAAQSYPADLLDVVVVDDGSDRPLGLPHLRPARTRTVRGDGSWGRPHACHVGALAASGEVIHWLDADMVPDRDEIAAQMRWHHVVDYAVVLGHKTFVDILDDLPPAEVVRERVSSGRPGELFTGRWTAPHEWVEEHVARTDGLTKNPTMSFLVHVGSTASVGRDLYFASGGMDAALKLGEDVELGYRLAQQGAVFVPDVDARSWHLGRSTLMEQQDMVNAYNRPFVTDRVPSLRHWRTKGRSYTVPWIEIVVDATASTFEETRHSVDGALTGSVHDVEVVLVGPWSHLTDARRSPLQDPARELRMVAAEFGGEPRVRLVEAPVAAPSSTTFRLHLPAGWSPGVDSARRLAAEMARRDRGLVQLMLPDGRVGRLERTSAFHRAARTTHADEDIDDVVDQVSETWWYDGPEEGFTHVSKARAEQTAPSPRKRPRRPGAADRSSLPGAAAAGTQPPHTGEPRPRIGLRDLFGRRTGSRER